MSHLFSAKCTRWGSCSGGTCPRQWSTGGHGEEKDCRGLGHGWGLHTDCIRSAQNCKLCFSTAGYYPQPILFLCCLWFFCYSSFVLLPPFNLCHSLVNPVCTNFLSCGDDRLSIHQYWMHTVSLLHDSLAGFRTEYITLSNCPMKHRSSMVKKSRRHMLLVFFGLIVFMWSLSVLFLFIFMSSCWIISSFVLRCFVIHIQLYTYVASNYYWSVMMSKFTACEHCCVKTHLICMIFYVMSYVDVMLPRLKFVCLLGGSCQELIGRVQLGVWCTSDRARLSCLCIHLSWFWRKCSTPKIWGEPHQKYCRSKQVRCSARFNSLMFSLFIKSVHSVCIMSIVVFPLFF